MTPNEPSADSDDWAALWATGGPSIEDEQRESLERAKADAALAADAGAIDYLPECAEPVAPPDRIKNEIMKRLAGRIPKITVRRAEGARWDQTPNPRLTRRLLNVDRERGLCTMMLRMSAGGVLEGHIHSGAEECLVLSGDLQSNGEELGPGDYFFAEPGSVHADLTTVNGCECLLVTALGD
jgi:anti-sigma factor ChrR (cupin superfamily)